MAYFMMIGELEVIPSNESCKKRGYSFSIKEHSIDTLKNHATFTLEELSHFASFTGLGNFINNLFGGLNLHSTIVPITAQDAIDVNLVYDKFMSDNPNMETRLVDSADSVECKCFARLLWFTTWVNWAVENCEKPSFCCV
jgi:hypothetical protein